MKESMQIAYTFSRVYCQDVLNLDYLETNEIHIHAPEGAVPKDGPSAGIAITSALISLAKNQPIKNNFAMTGEISLRGKVMKIGGVKEKTLAAKRENVENLIFPKDNEEDVLELDQDIRDGIKFHFVENYSEVYSLLFEWLNIIFFFFRRNNKCYKTIDKNFFSNDISSWNALNLNLSIIFLW